jgi:hypothetical protein
MKDEVITALWKIKDQISHEHDHEVGRLAATVRRKEQAYPERVVDWSRRRSAAGSQAASDS